MLELWVSVISPLRIDLEESSSFPLRTPGEEAV
jgi:hypothetical protein